MEEKDSLITKEDWEETVDNWVTKATGDEPLYGCGFCRAMREHNKHCFDCPADVSNGGVCDYRFTTTEVLNEEELTRLSLEALQWLHEYGTKRGWT